ncbi:hypothetical protein BN14_08585 [Rhizoctonia solani AG-1 IB]|uniref:Copia protein n=1 Tax=Thanatephorus cucumeris (strain AG1-IB / isolate 7/3/14) TaxID=1108050 RepID=M5C5X1_THACB|nr:hypothetical protein BN14_08585 [Rhizoctonia solani AG-1 IB]
MRIDSGMADKYWGYAILHAANVSNVTPKRFLNGQTPEEVFTGKKPNVSRLQIFGCKAWARIPENKRSKLQAQSIEFDHATSKIITLRDVVFDEGGETHQQIIIEDFDDEVPEEVGDVKNKQKDTAESIKGESKPEKVEPKSEGSNSESDDTNSTPVTAPELSEAPSTPPRASTPPP